VVRASKLLFALWFIALIAVFLGSLGPAPEIIEDVGGDKVIHFLAYGTLGFLFTLAYLLRQHFSYRNLSQSPYLQHNYKPNSSEYKKHTTQKLIFTMSLMALGHSILGGIIEILQGFTGRQPDFYDGVANSLGSSIGVLGGWICYHFMESVINKVKMTINQGVGNND